MDLKLSADQSAIIDAARTFVEREVAPYAADWDRTEELDRAIVAKLVEVGFLGCVIPEEYGGMGVSNVDYCLIVEELAKGCSSVRSLISVNVGLVSKSVMKWGTPEQKREWLPQLASGERLGCFGLTEANSGSDPASLVTSARRDGGDFLISGAKMFITNGGWAGLALIFARTGGPGSRGISCFLVPTSSPGFSTRAIKGKLGLRAGDTAEVYLDDVRVPASACLGGEGNGMKVAMSALDSGRMGLAAGCVGVAQASVDVSITYSKERQQFGRPIARFQLVQELIADMAVETAAARLLTWQVAILADDGQPFTVPASYAKYYASETAVRASNAALQVHGGYGYIDEYSVGRLVRDARVTTLYEGTSQIHKLLIGRHLTGENAFL